MQAKYLLVLDKLGSALLFVIMISSPFPFFRFV
jgi:hypothetical protein